MAARKSSRGTSTDALEKEVQQLQDRLHKARQDQLTTSETLVNKLRRGLDAARKKERNAREKEAAIKRKPKTAAQSRQLETARKQRSAAREELDALSREMSEAQEAHRGHVNNTKRQAELAKRVARETAAYDKKHKRKSRARATKAR